MKRDSYHRSPATKNNMHMYRIQYYVYACMDAKDVATIEATEAAASVINSASYIRKYTTTLTKPRACHDKFVC